MKNLDLTGCDIFDREVFLLCEALSSPACRLETLTLAYTGIGDDGAEALADTLKEGACTLRSLSLAYTRISNRGAYAFTGALSAGGPGGSHQCSLQTLSLAYTRIRESGACALARALVSDGCALQTLELENRCVGAVAFKRSPLWRVCYRLQHILLGAR